MSKYHDVIQVSDKASRSAFKDKYILQKFVKVKTVKRKCYENLVNGYVLIKLKLFSKKKKIVILLTKLVSYSILNEVDFQLTNTYYYM